MKILITGFFGASGQYLSSYLSNHFEVVVSDYIKTGDNIPYEFILMDITKADQVKEKVKKVDAVVHLATSGCSDLYDVTYEDTIRVNVMGTLNLLEAALENNIKKFIYISSLRVYGIPTIEDTVEYFPIDEKHPLKPAQHYGLSKVLAEDLCRGFARNHDISIICLRPGHIQNIQQKVSRYRELTKKQEIESNKNTLYTHVDRRDLGQAIMLALKSNIEGFEVFNIDSGDHYFNMDSIDFIRKFYPEVKEIRNVDEFFGNNRKSFIDTSKLKELLGYKPEYSYKRYLEWMNMQKDEDEYFKISNK